MEALVEVVDHVPVINFRNCITVSKVPFDVVTQGLGGSLCNAAQIPSGFGARAGCLVVLDEGSAKVVPAIDRADRKRLEVVLCLPAHHHREVCRHDVVVAICYSNGDGVGAQPCFGVGLAIELFDADRLEGRGPLDGSQPVGEGGEAVQVIRQVVVVVAGSAIAVVADAVGCAMLVVVAAMSFPLGVVPLAMTVVDTELKISAGETVAKVGLVDLFITAMRTHRAVGA